MAQEHGLSLVSHPHTYTSTLRLGQRFKRERGEYLTVKVKSK